VTTFDARDPEALFHRGNRRRDAGDHRGAIADYERALERAPGHPGLLNNLGLALEAVGESDRAQACYREVLARDPRHADALLNLANLRSRAGGFAEAAALHERAAAVRPVLEAAVWVQRALAQERIGDVPRAETSLQEAARLAPDDARIHANLATLYVRQRRHADAEGPLQRVLELDPEHAQALCMLAYVRQQRCAWDGLDELHARIGRLLDERDAGTSRFNPFPLLAMPMSLRQLRTAARSWGRGFAAPGAPQPPPAAPQRGERLRVGFVSSDFRPHATTYLLLEFWERLDRRRIESFAYAIAPPDPDAAGERIRSAFEHFADVSSESNAGIARRIRADRVSVLFDLNGYTRHAREGIFAQRPVAVQVNAFGYLGTLGAPWYDWVLTDRFATPPPAQAHFDERFLELDCYCPSATAPDIAPDPGARASHGLPAEGIVFCCFNASYKLLPDVFATWMRILAVTPRSVLWLTEARGDSTDNLRRSAADAGIDPARLVFAPRLPLPRHLARHAHADLFLDTAPYNAGATANDALAMGLPIVTCCGETMASRVAGSQLRAAGLPELVATELAQYESLAKALAAEPATLASYRERLRANRRTAPLFDVARYARGFEAALERLFTNQISPS
jgi:predicted O-linked N-acetylglucosamine transferase (SPINDLY family)